MLIVFVRIFVQNVMMREYHLTCLTYALNLTEFASTYSIQFALNPS